MLNALQGEASPASRQAETEAASVLGGDVRGDLMLSVRQLQWGARCNVWSLAHLGEAMAGNEWWLSCSPESFARSHITAAMGRPTRQ